MKALVPDKFKIFERIIEAVSVNMMDNLPRFQFSPDVDLHDIPMLKDSCSIGEGNFLVPIRDYRSFSVEVAMNLMGTSESFKPLIMDVAIPFGLMGQRTSFDGAAKFGFSFRLSHSDVGISKLSRTLEMHGAHPPASGIPFAAFYGTFCDGHLMPPFSDDSLFPGISYSEKRRNGKHRVNSGKPKSKDMAIPSQARSTLPEGVETTGGV